MGSDKNTLEFSKVVLLSETKQNHTNTKTTSVYSFIRKDIASFFFNANILKFIKFNNLNFSNISSYYQKAGLKILFQSFYFKTFLMRFFPQALTVTFFQTEFLPVVGADLLV